LSSINLAVGGRARRFVRVAKGLADPTSRPRYVAQARRLVAERGSSRHAERCLVCRSHEVRQTDIRFAMNKARVCRVHICGRCGYIGNPTNANDSTYRAREHPDDLPSSTRAGTLDRLGREYYMAEMACDILDRDELDILVYGAGRSLDNHHIERLPRVRSVAIGDVMRIRSDAEFVDLGRPASRRFPVVIASEVIEHFRSPREDFAALFGFVERGGLAICGTNVYAGGELSTDRYLFFADHTSYYSPESLAILAHAAGFRVDSRAPLVGTAMRKRYVIFTKSSQVLERVACYFGRHTFAPSEMAMSTPKVRAKQLNHR
jgi:hypothetical protein